MEVWIERREDGYYVIDETGDAFGLVTDEHYIDVHFSIGAGAPEEDLREWIHSLEGERTDTDYCGVLGIYPCANDEGTDRCLAGVKAAPLGMSILQVKKAGLVLRCPHCGYPVDVEGLAERLYTSTDAKDYVHAADDDSWTRIHEVEKKS